MSQHHYSSKVKTWIDRVTAGFSPDELSEIGRLEKLVEAIPGVYEDLIIAVCCNAAKHRKAQQFIDYIEDTSPDPSELVEFLDEINGY